MYRVYTGPDGYRVVQEGKHEEEYSHFIQSNVVEFLQERFECCRISAEEASFALEEVATDYHLPYTYGHKLRYYAQSALLVLVARGHASIEKERQKFLYTVYP